MNEMELAQQIGELRGIVVEGFKGVHQRQDTTNGRIGKLEIRVEDLESNDSERKGMVKGIKTSWTFVIQVATILLMTLGVIYGVHAVIH